MVAKIELHRRGQSSLWSLVSDEDSEFLSVLRWHPTVTPYTTYARTKVVGAYGQETTKVMHRFVMEQVLGRSLLLIEEVDHRNHDGLDNRRTNLRLASKSQNQRNQRPQCGTSQSKGVSWHKLSRKWQAKITLGGRAVHLGYFQLETDATERYRLAAAEYYGEFAYREDSSA